MIAQPKQNGSRQSQTPLLFTGLFISYAGFILWLGVRLIVLLSGAVIVVLTITFWYVQLKRQKTKSSAISANLLQPDVFLSHITYLNKQIPDASQPLWQSVQEQALAIQQITTQIAQQESTLTPDLLETLHTIIDLIELLVQAVQVTAKVQTLHYRELAQKQLENSLNRLQQTQDQLQELHDQLAFDNLGRPTLSIPNVISIRLQTLIKENEREILGN